MRAFKLLGFGHRKVMCVVLMIFVCCVAKFGAAQFTVPAFPNAPDPNVPAPAPSFKGAYDFKTGLENAVARSADLFNSVIDEGKKISAVAAVSSLSTGLAWSFGVIAIVLVGSKMALGDGEWGDVIETFLIIGVFSAFLQQGNYLKLVSAIVEMMSNLSNGILGGASGFTNPVIPTNKLTALSSAIGIAADSFLNNVPKGAVNILEHLDQFFISVILAFIGLLLCLVAMFFIMIYLNIGNVFMAIAIAVGPIFIACGVWKPVRVFFEKWINFFLIGGMYQVVASIMIKLILGVATTSLPTTSTAGAGYENAINMMILVMSLATIAYCTTLIPDIVNGLMPGSIGGAKVNVKLPKGGK